MDNLIAVGIIIIIVGLAVLYIYRAKKRGSKCIGCPYGETCMKKSCGCDSAGQE